MWCLFGRELLFARARLRNYFFFYSLINKIMWSYCDLIPDGNSHVINNVISE
jgi:hypothetical protein